MRAEIICRTHSTDSALQFPTVLYQLAMADYEKYEGLDEMQLPPPCLRETWTDRCGTRGDETAPRELPSAGKRKDGRHLSMSAGLITSQSKRVFVTE